MLNKISCVCPSFTTRRKIFLFVRWGSEWKKSETQREKAKSRRFGRTFYFLENVSVLVILLYFALSESLADLKPPAKQVLLCDEYSVLLQIINLIRT